MKNRLLFVLELQFDTKLFAIPIIEPKGGVNGKIH